RLIGGGDGADFGGAFFSPDGRFLAATLLHRATVRVYTVASGGARTFEAPDEIAGIAFAPGGHELAAATAAGAVIIWSLDSGAAPRTRRGGQTRPWWIVWSSDGRRLATAGEDGTVALWDAAGGAALATYTGHRGAVRDLAFAPDGSFVASAGA